MRPVRIPGCPAVPCQPAGRRSNCRNPNPAGKSRRGPAFPGSVDERFATTRHVHGIGRISGRRDRCVGGRAEGAAEPLRTDTGVDGHGVRRHPAPVAAPRVESRQAAAGEDVDAGAPGERRRCGSSRTTSTSFRRPRISRWSTARCASRSRGPAWRATWRSTCSSGTLADAQKSRAICDRAVGNGIGRHRRPPERSRSRAASARAGPGRSRVRWHAAQARSRTGVVDFVLPVADIPRKLDAAQNTRKAASSFPATMASTRTAEAGAPRGRWRCATFSRSCARGPDTTSLQYKRATVLRRIERRLQVNALRDLPAYRDYLRDNAGETAPLLQDMLISVTQLLPRPRRVRCAGARRRCPRFRAQDAERPGTRLGGRLRDRRGSLFDRDSARANTRRRCQSPPAIQIFATDIDEEAVAFARAALYPEGSQPT